MNPLHRIHLYQTTPAWPSIRRMCLEANKSVCRSIVITNINADTCRLINTWPQVKVGRIDRPVRGFGEIPRRYSAIIVWIVVAPDKYLRELRVRCPIILGHSDFNFIQKDTGPAGHLIVVEIFVRPIGDVVARPHVQDQHGTRHQAHAGNSAIRSAKGFPRIVNTGIFYPTLSIQRTCLRRPRFDSRNLQPEPQSSPDQDE